MSLPAELIQVAGVRNAAELAMLCELGVPMVGFPLRPEVHAPELSERTAAGLIAGLPEGTRAVLITYLAGAAAVATLTDALGVRIVQLHGAFPPEQLRLLRERRPGLGIIRSLVVCGHNERALREQVAESEGLVDAWITDTHDPVTGATGATGRTHDWAVSARLAAVTRRPLILAGGLTPDNVAEAIAVVRPAGVDAHTGLEDHAGRKDRAKVQEFLDRARQALAAL